MMASLAAAIVLSILIWFFPTYVDKSNDMYEVGRDFQESKLLFAGCFSVIFSAIYPLFDQILDTLQILDKWLYQSSKSSAPAILVDDSRKSSVTFTESTFLVERWIAMLSSIICSILVLIHMTPSCDPIDLMYFVQIFANMVPFLGDGCALSMLRQTSSKFLTTKITIFIWISRLVVHSVMTWSPSVPLRAGVSMISLLIALYPVKKHYFRRRTNTKSSVSPLEIDIPGEIDNKKKFDKRLTTIYYSMYLLILLSMFVRIMPWQMDDPEKLVVGAWLGTFLLALILPCSLLLLNPKRLYARWQEEKIEFLHKHSIQLLEGLLPGKVLKHFRESKEPFVESFDCVTILFADIMDFTVVCQLLTPPQIVLLMGDIFSQFDEAAKSRGVYRVETVGDCYMASTGCPDAEDPSVAADKMVLFAQDVIKIVRNIQPPVDLGFPLQIRIGVHSGPVTAGTLSGTMPRYCLFGDTVNTASRMESTGEVARIHLSDETVSLLRKDATCLYEFESRLPMHVKGKGVMYTYFLDTPEDMASTHDVHFKGSRSRSTSERIEPEARSLLKSLSISMKGRPFSFMWQNKAANASYPHHRERFVSPMTSDSVNNEGREGRTFVVPSSLLDSELGMVANLPKREPMGMAFAVASSLLSWDFDVQNIISKDMLIDIAFTLFKTSWLCGPLGVSEVTLRNYIENVAGSYHRKSFHNLQHAVSVLHTTSLLSNYCNQQKNMMGYGLMPSVSRFALMIGALVHDCDHPGHTNSFEVGTNSSLAQKYGNVAVLENHHLAVAESVLSKPGCNILESFDENTATTFRKLLRYIVLGTDMGVHKEIVSDIENLVTELDTEREKNLSMFTLCRALLHAADLSNPVRTFVISKAWAIRLADEHTKQVQAEAALGLSSAQFMVHKDTLSVYKGEIQFLTYVAQPLWTAMANLWPQLNFLPEQLHFNIQNYQDLINKASVDKLRISTTSVSGS